MGGVCPLQPWNPLTSEPLGGATIPTPAVALEEAVGASVGRAVSKAAGNSVTRAVTNSAGKTVARTLVASEDDLLAAAERHAGGSLDNFTEYKPGWWQSPDGKMRIEFNLEGHANVNEGPHVTIRMFDGQRHSVVEKVFIRGREAFK